MKDLLVLAFSSTDDIKMVQYLLFWNEKYHQTRPRPTITTIHMGTFCLEQYYCGIDSIQKHQ